MKPYLIYLFIGLVFLSLIRTSFKIDRIKKCIRKIKALSLNEEEIISLSKKKSLESSLL